jgi:hypothetical protein
VICIKDVKEYFCQTTANAYILEYSDEWPKEILDLFTRDIKTLFLEEMPDTKYTENETLFSKFLGNDDCKSAFKKSNCYKWLYKILQDHKEIYFGELSQLLHSALINDPLPYRREVKIVLSNLLSWTQNCTNDVL